MLPRALGEAANSISNGGEIAESLARAVTTLEKAGFDVDYVLVVNDNLKPLSKVSEIVGSTRILGAARLGATRLIDNLPVILAK